MTNYMRVLPRDAFNEAKLLKCIGQLSLLIHNGVGIRWPLSLQHAYPKDGFQIMQDQGSGNIYCQNLALKCGKRRIHLHTPLNSREIYPLIFEDRDVWAEGEVFTDDGKLNPMFEMYLDDLVELLGIKPGSIDAPSTSG